MLDYAINNEPVGECVPIPTLTNQPNTGGIRIMANSSIPEIKKVCQVMGCNQPFHAHGYCSRHNTQIVRCGKILKQTIFDPNEFIIEQDGCKIKLRNRRNQDIAEAIIDTKDLELVAKRKWNLSVHGYVVSNKKPEIRLSSYLLGPIPNIFIIDHKDRNPLNNKRSNLRLATYSQNGANAISNKGTNKFKGVRWNKINRNWLAYIKYQYKQYHLGCFPSKVEAAEAYNKKAVELWGEFALLNET